MTVDEILANPIASLVDLPAGAVPIAVVILLEYAEPAAEHFPGRPRISMNVDDNMSPWKSMGMMQYAIGQELAAIAEQRHDADDD